VGLFDPSALRAEDTLLLASLMQRGELPFFVTKGDCHSQSAYGRTCSLRGGRERLTSSSRREECE
jgi:hypothetical protein